MASDGNKMITSAPAKLNLSLRVLGRRDDGFHEIETLMVPLPGLADRIEIGEADAFAFECDHPGVPADDSNLAVRALRLFERRSGTTLPLRLRLEKHVPAGAGLGGGSSDAAAVLRLLAERAGGVPPDTLAELAAELGSDVPFFLADGPAWCRGRGERIEPAPDLAALPVLLLKPWFAVSTPEAYRRWRDAQPLPGIDHAPQPGPAGPLVNDLEAPVFSKHLFLAELRHWLQHRDETTAALMSGSGSTVFALLHPDANPDTLAAAARSQLDPELWSWSGHTKGNRGQS
jgi:4-diphosphocytidyl-2-C-methyl-D-erythritol kinase